ncbi:MAG: toprim domain-containing protein [Burkholderiales bacterium]|nr:toprim domain-containing protein [Burkholderiales bacterium]
MASIDDLKRRIDLHDLAHRLGLERPNGKRGNYRSPAHEDKLPSLSIFVRNSEQRWRDHSTNESGTCVDLVMYVRGCDVAGAVKELHDLYAIPPDPPKHEAPREKSRAEYIAAKCAANPAQARAYLEGRGIAPKVIDAAIAARSLGFNDWTSDKIPAGQDGYGGPAVAFVVRSLDTSMVQAVDFRYLDPTLNGGRKTGCQGDRQGFGWTPDVRKLLGARVVVIVESPINALTVECANLPITAAWATRGTGNVQNLDLRWLLGKRVVICMDNDAPFEPGHQLAGLRPGLKAAWDLHERLTALDVSAQLVDQAEWKEGDDLNDVLQREGVDFVRQALRRVEPWLIPGMTGDIERIGKPRIFLPFHDLTQYGKYRVKEDFTSHYTEKKTTDSDGDEVITPVYSDLAGFRVAALSRVTIQGPTATVTGDPDTQPNVAFAVAVQTPRHGSTLIRRVVEDEKLHNIDTWKKFGPVFSQSPFLRMINILERAAAIGARHAANFVGLCYREGRLVVNEGADTYFLDPKQQCPYYNLTFPSGTVHDARTVIKAYQATFRRNAASMPLVWALGAHLKVFLGFWPHMEMQADKGHGKSTLAGRLERTVAMKVFSKEAIKTSFRLVVTTAHTSQPVGWEEISANRMEVIDAAVSLLQEAYNFKPSPRGSGMLEFLTCAPVLLIGEDVPVRSLIGKLVRTSLTGKKGDMLADELPRFPVRQWMEFLASQTRSHVRQVFDQLRDHCLAQSMASKDDDGAVRMAHNYAALLTAWRFLSEFAGVDVREGDFGRDVIAEMNSHIRETSADREPWVWIMETVLSEIAAGHYRYPYLWDRVQHPETRRYELCLLLRTSHVMDHLSSEMRLREKWSALPVKSDRVFRRQLTHSGCLVDTDVERVIEASHPGDRKRIAHLVAISLDRLEGFGLHATPVGREVDLVSLGNTPAPPHE